MKLFLLATAILSTIRSQETIIDEKKNDGYYLNLVEKGKTKSMEVILAQFNCFKDMFTDRQDLQIINDIEAQLAKNLTQTTEPQSFSLVDVSVYAKDPSVRGVKLDAKANSSSIENLYYNISLNIIKGQETDFLSTQSLFYQPSIMNCMKVIPKSCKFTYSVDDVYQRVCD